jgi:hypothetical protein
MTEPTGKPRGRPPGSKNKVKADAPPREKSGAQKRHARKAGDIQLIRSELEKFLTFPAMPAGMKGDQWAVDHFTVQGPALAAQIAAECERNDQLRKYCLQLVKGSSLAMLGVSVFMYAIPPLMHYGIVPGAERLGVPTLTKSKQARAEAPGFGADQKPAPPPPEPEPQGEDEVETPTHFEVPEEDPLAAELRANGTAPPPPVEAV